MTGSGASPSLDRIGGRWRVHAPLSLGVIGLYGALILIVFVFGRPGGSAGSINPLWLVDGLLLVFLARYASTSYSMDADRLYARRIFGSRSIRLEDVRRIELANLRDLSPASFFGGWGWRGRMWSPMIGSFDAVHTVSTGVLVHARSVPLFVSPPDPSRFAQELSRRARSYFDGVEVGPGIPGGTVPGALPAS
ncbi:MAG: PH domain-containing protein [Thermoplasmata archaeon]|nr:PH domain-containing protein [Thermoplasmata archaeon]